MEKKALVAMSGGVDSSVAAYLMQKDGYTCIGAMMKLISNKLSEKCHLENSTGQTCCALDDAEDARSVAYRLGFLFYVFDFSEDFEKNVIDKFVKAYETGFTPNPCLECNRFLKFDRLYRRAQELGCDSLVTGHYARIEHENGRYLLKKGVDPKKDQSYFLYSMTQDQLCHTKFPLGVMHKEEIRRIAEEQGFVNAHKPDSQDICFVPGGDYAAFLETYTGKAYPEGNFIGTDGTVLGTHRGAVRFTIGQRKGLGIALGSPMYVTAKDMTENTVTLAPNEALFTDELTADELNWISVEELTGPLRVQAKIRYRHTEQPALITPAGSGQVHVKFDEPQRAITPGQAVVFYNGDTVVGGGRILR